MQPNNAGGYGFVLDDWERLHRFLILGSEGGTYYVGEAKLTEQNAATVIRCIKADGPRVVREAARVNVDNLAPKTDQQLFVVALAMKHGDTATKGEVAAAAPGMLRTGTHMLHFVAMLDGLGGWSRAKRRIVASWFRDHDADRLAYQVLKYQNRDGWTMRDALRVTHPVAPSAAHNAVYAWSCGKVTDEEEPHLPAILKAHRGLTGEPKERALAGIAAGLPREVLPTEAVNDPDVQRALLPAMPLHALLRNLGNLSATGVLAETDTVRRLTDRAVLRKSRVHPFAILLASIVYQQGHGVRGGKTWPVLRPVVEALGDAYEAAFDSVTPTGKRILVSVDISGSMTFPCQGTPIPCALAAAAMALTLARTEPHATVVMADTEVRAVVPITKRSSLSGLANTSGRGTDLSAPVRWATGRPEVEGEPEREIMVGGTSWVMRAPRPVFGVSAVPARHFDSFVILTDNETWAGCVHPSQALAAYRKAVNPRARLVCASMAANDANVVDPDDALSLGCAGLDASLPAIVGEFIGRE